MLSDIISFIFAFISCLGTFLVISMLIAIFSCIMQRLYYKVIFSKEIKPNYEIWVWIGMIILIVIPRILILGIP
mgnify:CR=1 FL=1